MTLAIALVGIVVLAGLAVLIGRLEQDTAKRAFRDVAARRRENGEERRRLLDRQRDLEDLARELADKQQQLDRLEERLRSLERPPRSARPDGDADG